MIALLRTSREVAADKTDMVHDLGLLQVLQKPDNGVQVAIPCRLKRFLPTRRARTP